MNQDKLKNTRNLNTLIESTAISSNHGKGTNSSFLLRKSCKTESECRTQAKFRPKHDKGVAMAALKAGFPRGGVSLQCWDHCQKH